MATKLGNPKQTIEIIQKHGFMFQKKFGQNFLIDTRVLEKIVAAAGVTKDDCVLEKDRYQGAGGRLPRGTAP